MGGSVSKGVALFDITTVYRISINLNPNPKPEFLKENVVTEANVTYLSTADNLVEMPVSMR